MLLLLILPDLLFKLTVLSFTLAALLILQTMPLLFKPTIILVHTTMLLSTVLACVLKIPLHVTYI